jgi:hypothetical protein
VNDEHVNQHDDAKSQDEERELLDSHRVFAGYAFVRHDGDSLPQVPQAENGSGVHGTRVTCLKFAFCSGHHVRNDQHADTPHSAVEIHDGIEPGLDEGNSDADKPEDRSPRAER